MKHQRQNVNILSLDPTTSAFLTATTVGETDRLKFSQRNSLTTGGGPGHPGLTGLGRKGEREVGAGGRTVFPALPQRPQQLTEVQL